MVKDISGNSRYLSATLKTVHLIYSVLRSVVKSKEHTGRLCVGDCLHPGSHIVGGLDYFDGRMYIIWPRRTRCMVLSPTD